MGPERERSSASATLRPMKITAVGDGMVGKTCMLIAYTAKEYPEEYVPTVFENYADNIEVDGQNFNMTLWDTAGQEDYERLRPLSYPKTQCFLLCFSTVSRASYENVSSKWTPEIRHHCPDVPIVLVGTKIDLRQNENPEHFTTSDGKKLKRKIKATAYVECSAKEMRGLEDVFITAVRAAVNKKHAPRSPKCSVL